MGSSLAWFTDSRTPVRRMKVSRHEDADLIVLSLWQGGRCTGTFRLPVENAPELIHLLVDGLASPRHGPSQRPAPALRQKLADFLARRRRPVAPVVNLRRGSVDS